jgi:hypothetical protein
MKLAERALAYATAFQEPASHLHVVREQRREVLYGRWLIGARYGNETAYYGAYPRTYLARVLALFPDVPACSILHVFAGSVPKGAWTRLDCNPKLGTELVGYVQDVQELVGGRRFPLVLADPPYSQEGAIHYGTPMIDRRTVVGTLAGVTKVGGHLVWLDDRWPMHSKHQWVTVGRIALTRATNHRIRDISIFERVAA